MLGMLGDFCALAGSIPDKHNPASIAVVKRRLHSLAMSPSIDER
jgi:hypothetical protein